MNRMAEGTSASPDDTVCPFLLYSTLEQRGRCQPHESTRRSNVICRFYLQGKCRFGDTCWNIHSQAKSDANTKSTGRNDRHSAGPSRQRNENREISGPPKPDNSKKNAYEPKYSFLNKNTLKNEDLNANAFGPNPPNWVNAPEFVPKTTRSYADTLKSNTVMNDDTEKMPPMELCPYFVTGVCPFEEQCLYVHGDMCELCQKACLNPFDENQRKMHNEMCEKELEQDMELSFAIQRSMDKSCGICMDIIMEKEPISERRFGILEKCNHIFCLSCIRKWRKVKSFESNTTHIDNVVDPVVTRACPECRVSSDFITPSQYWVDTEDEKSKLISDYKVALSKKPCKYFKQGKGTCPFGGACFYLHAKPDGTKVDLPPPVRRRRQNQDGELDFMGRIVLWDYLEFREENILMQLDLDDFVYSMSDTSEDTSEASDNFFLSESF